MAKKLSKSDRNANRRNAPGTAAQQRARNYEAKGVLGNVISSVDMNFGGVSGGLPTGSRGELDSRAKAYDKEGATSSASAARSRSRNLKGHEVATNKTKKAIAARRAPARGRGAKKK